MGFSISLTPINILYCLAGCFLGQIVGVSWTEVATVYAAIEPLIGREYFMNREVQSDLSTKVRIRFRDDVQVNWRVAFGTRIFDIQSVINPFMKNEELLLMCAELPQ